MIWFLLLLFLLACGLGSYGSARNWGYGGWSPAGILLLILLILIVTGNLHV